MDQLGQLIEQHLKFIKSSEHLTDLMLKRAQFSDFNELDRLSRNRERLHLIIIEQNSQIETLIFGIGLEELKHRNDYSFIKQWAKDLDSWSKRTLQKDLEITSHLTKLKQETGREISALFKSKQQFRGYNLSSTKR